jgi:hypothetical protein
MSAARRTLGEPGTGVVPVGQWHLWSQPAYGDEKFIQIAGKQTYQNAVSFLQYQKMAALTFSKIVERKKRDIGGNVSA